MQDLKGQNQDRKVMLSPGNDTDLSCGGVHACLIKAPFHRPARLPKIFIYF